MNATIVLLLAKASVLLAVALIGARYLSRESAGRRHQLWSAAFLALILLPALGIVLPPIEVDLPAPPSVVLSEANDLVPPPAVVPSDAKDPLQRPAVVLSDAKDPLQQEKQVLRSAQDDRLLSIRQALVWTWALGVSLAIIALLVSLIRVQLLVRRGRLVADPEWWGASGAIAGRLGFNRPIRLIVADGVVTPMAAGLITPTVFLPPDAPSWPAERREVVLAHEIAHLASRDPLRHLMGRAALTLYWFHPLAWLAARDATTACEQACDEAVLSLGVRPSDYAQVLLDFAGGAPPSAPAAALPIVRRPLLETRLMAILETSPRPSTRRMVIPALAGAALTLCIAAVQPATATPTPASVAPHVTTPDAAAPATSPLAKLGELSSQLATAAIAAPAAGRTPGAAAQCGRTDWDGGYSGTTISSRGDDVVDRVVERTFSDLRICAHAERAPKGDLRPSEWFGRADQVAIETDERTGDYRRMIVTRSGVVTYSVNGRPVAVDGETEQWRRAVVEALDAMWQVSQLRGQVSTLRGEISTRYGERSTLLGEISTLRGEMSTLQGEISTIRGEESTMRGEISTIRGQYSTLQGQISTERGAISSLQAAKNDRYADRLSIDAAIRRHEDAIRGIEDEIARYDVEAQVRKVERRIADFDADGKVREVQRRIGDFDVEAKIADVQRRISRLNVEGEVADIEREISSLDAESRVRALEARQDSAIRELRARLRR